MPGVCSVFSINFLLSCVLFRLPKAKCLKSETIEYYIWLPKNGSVQCSVHSFVCFSLFKFPCFSHSIVKTEINNRITNYKLFIKNMLKNSIHIAHRFRIPLISNIGSQYVSNVIFCFLLFNFNFFDRN